MAKKLGKENRAKKIHTVWGFPVAENPGGTKPSKTNRGISLLIALMAIAFMMGVVTDLIVTTSVSTQLTIATKDRIKAEYLAKSGFNLGIFLLTVAWGVDIYRAQPNIPPPFGKPLSDDDSSLWTILNDVPPMGSSNVKMIKESTKGEKDPFKLKGIFSEEIANQMSLFEDEFSVKIEDEGKKININDCSKSRCTEVINQLLALFSCPAEKAYLETKNLTPEQLAYRIKDFVSDSPTTSQESGFNDKNSPYQDYLPPYKVKGLPFDAVNDLKLIQDWDEDIHNIFSPYLTVYPFNNTATKTKNKSGININTVDKELLTCLVPEAKQRNCADSFILKLQKLKDDKSAVVDKDIGQTLRDMMCYTPPENRNEEQDKTTWFDIKSSVFKITINSETGDQDRKLEAIVRRIEPKDKENGRSKQEVKRAYQILFWKII